MGTQNIYINADDYGADISRSIGIYLAAEARIINSLSALVLQQTPLEQWFLRRARKRIGVRVGLHVDLTSPRLLTATTSGLLQDKIKFHDKRDIWIGFLSERIDYVRVKKEITAQLAKFQKICGSNPDFIDAHNHVHIANPTVYSIFNDISKTEGIPFIRIPRDKMVHLPNSSLSQKLSAFVSSFSARYQGEDNSLFLCILAKNMRTCRLSDIALYELCVSRLLKENKYARDKARKHYFYGTAFGHSRSISGLVHIFKEIALAQDQFASHEIMLHPGLNLWTNKSNPFSCKQRLSELVQTFVVGKFVLPSLFDEKYKQDDLSRRHPQKRLTHSRTNQKTGLI